MQQGTLQFTRQQTRQATDSPAAAEGTGQQLVFYYLMPWMYVNFTPTAKIKIGNSVAVNCTFMAFSQYKTQ